MADVKLPPLPPRVPVDKHLPTGVVIYGYTNDMMCDYARDYARANVAAKDAEIEALRAEVERLTGYVQGWEQNYRDEKARAERLAEALRKMADGLDADAATARAYADFSRAGGLKDAADEFRAVLRAQEGDHE